MDSSTSDASADLTLVVAWQVGRRYDARMISISREVATWFRERASLTLDQCAAVGADSYDPDAEQGDAPVLNVASDEIFDEQLLEALRPDRSFQRASLEELKPKRLFCYAIIFGNDEHAAVLIRKLNPMKTVGRSTFARWTGQHIDRITEQVLQFDGHFDVVAVNGQLQALSKRGFEDLFRHSDVVLGRVDSWIDGVFGENLPISAEQREGLRTRAARNSFTLRKLHRVFQRTHIRTLSIDDIRAGVRDHGWNEDEFIVNGQLNVTETSEKRLLALLNEDTFQGRYSHDRFTATGKRAG